MRRSLFSSIKKERYPSFGPEARGRRNDDVAAAAASPTDDKKKENDNNMTVFRVHVPPHVRPGDYFQADAGGRIVRIQCPLSYKEGQHLKVSLPTNIEEDKSTKKKPSSPYYHSRGYDDEIRSSIHNYHRSLQHYHNKKYHPKSSDHEDQHHNDEDEYSNRHPQHKQHQHSRLDRPVLPHLPQHDEQHPHDSFSSHTEQQHLNRNHEDRRMHTRRSRQQRHDDSSAAELARYSFAEANQPHDRRTRINHNRQNRTFSTRLPPSVSNSSQHRPSEKTDDDGDAQLFEVQVPDGVEPGAPFALMAKGVRVLVNCPLSATPGQWIQFSVPNELYTNIKKEVKGPAAIRLEYDKDGWTRRIRVSDLKFQWIRVDQDGEVDSHLQRFDIRHSAYVRKLQTREGPDMRFRQGKLGLVPASEAVMESRVKGKDGTLLVSYSDIANAQVKPFEQKAQWFHDTCAKLSVEWNEGHIRLLVRRQYLLGDSVDAIMSLSRKDMRKTWRFEFVGEEAIDAGGLTREWFQLVTQKIFDPDLGLWKSSAANQMSMEINPSSAFCCEDHLEYYRFIGRVMGKALFAKQICAGHMVRHMYKHLLGWPLTFADLETADAEYYNNLKQLEELVKFGQDLSLLCLDFTAGQQIFGVQEQIELVRGGEKIGLTNDNFPEYLEACLKYKLLDVVKPQLNQLLLGFFDIIPEPLLTVFDFQELELLMCGLPEIDMADWKRHTLYAGEYSANHPVCKWFWEIVDGFDHEMKARLLQFVTGTSGVPSRGFAVLQGNDGDIRKFTIKAVPAGTCFYPRAHTCFNRIDLPKYRTKEELEQRLSLAVTMCATGFDIE